MAGCEPLIDAWAPWSAVGEAFQMRDDILGVFRVPVGHGQARRRGPGGRKATSVVVAAQQMADATIRRQLARTDDRRRTDRLDIAHWRTLIVATGAADWIEELIAERVNSAIEHISDDRIDDWCSPRWPTWPRCAPCDDLKRPGGLRWPRCEAFRKTDHVVVVGAGLADCRRRCNSPARSAR